MGRRESAKKAGGTPCLEPGVSGFTEGVAVLVRQGGENHRVLLSSHEIRSRVRDLAREISLDYNGVEGDVLLVGILKGSFVFLADLMRLLSIDTSVDFMSVSSYGKATTTSGVVKILKDLEESVQGRHVLLVEDIVDTGLTLQFLRDNLESRSPASIKICVLLDKKERRLVDVPVDYTGFTVPDQFVIGYGLDYRERYRNLPYIAVVED